MVCALSQGLLFGIVGFGAGIAGTAVSNGLLAVRKKLDANFKLQNKPPNVLLNAGCWGTHMGISSNIRYQLLNGLDMVSYSKHPALIGACGCRVKQSTLNGGPWRHSYHINRL